MPGRVLIVEPALQHRIALKAALSRDYFAVTAIENSDTLGEVLASEPPDVLVLSLDHARGTGFAAVNRLRATSGRAHAPVVLLHHDDPQAWQDCHANLADEVLDYDAPRWLLVQRMNQLIRAKRKIDAMRARQRTLSDMGFGEEAAAYPPQMLRPLRVDLSRSGLSIAQGADLRHAMNSAGMPARGTGQDDGADLIVLGETGVGAAAARQALADLGRAAAGGDRPARVLYLVSDPDRAGFQALQELGAGDIGLANAPVAELATRLRRLGWARQFGEQTDRAMARHLQSALRDPLTDLFNRRYAERYLSQLADRLPESGWLTLMMVDIDNFKTINDRFGHAAGDAVLCETARRLRNGVRDSDLIARVGGEEFLVVLPDADADTAQGVAERLRRDIAARPFGATRDLAIPMSISIGVSQARPHDRPVSVQALLQDADRALYLSKAGGRNRVTFASSTEPPAVGTGIVG